MSGNLRKAFGQWTIQPGDRIQQTASVGMPRRGEQLLDAGAFNDLPGVHHYHPVGHFGHHPQVVSDEHHRDSALLVETPQQI